MKDTLSLRLERLELLAMKNEALVRSLIAEQFANRALLEEVLKEISGSDAQPKIQQALKKADELSDALLGGLDTSAICYAISEKKRRRAEPKTEEHK